MTQSQACHPWMVWQLLDSAFPTGAFGHSAGLEAAWQQGEVASAAELARFLRISLCQTAAGALPFLLGTCAAMNRFCEIDALQDAMLSNHVANRASRAQGKGLLATSVRVFGVPALCDLRDEVRRTASPGHLATLYGAVAAAFKIVPEQAAQMFLFGHLRGLVGAAVRLGIVGPLEAQTMQQDMAGFGSDLATRSMEAVPEDAAQVAPLLDLWQATHDRLYSRLFTS